MRQVVGIGLGLSAALVLTVSRADAQTASVPAKRTVTYPGVGVRDEEFVGESRGTLYFVSPNGSNQAGHPEAWVHAEEPEDRGPAGRPMRSALLLFEFDCSGKTMRQKLSIVAAASDLQKPYPPTPQPPSAWLPVGTEGIFKAYPKVCAGPAADK